MNTAEVQFAVFQGDKEIVPEMYKEVLSFAEYIKSLEDKQKLLRASYPEAE